MTLDDRSLREHLDRRAESGATDPETLAEAVMARVAATRRGGSWRGLGVRGPSLGMAAAALVVLVVALAVASPGIWQGPGTSTPSGRALAPDYPSLRALTVRELDAVLASDVAAHAGEVVIASVTLETFDVVCLGTACPRFLADLGGRQVGVHDPGEAEPVLPGASVLRIRSDGRLDLLGFVRSGPDGLAWTLPQLTAALVDLKGPGARPVPYLYLVDAWRAVSSAAIPCPPSGSPAGTPDFTCGAGMGWLVPDGSSIPTDPLAVPPGGLRLPNATASNEHGWWLVDPFVSPDACFMCSSAGAADLIGRVESLGELGIGPAASGGPSPTTPLAPEPTPTTRVITFVGEGFSFEYPDSWRLISGYEHVGLHGPTVLAAVGIGDFDLGCTYTETSASCDSDPRWTVPEAGVVLAYRFDAWLGPIVPQPTPSLALGQVRATVGGRAAVLTEGEGFMIWRFPDAPEFIEARWGSQDATTVRSQVEMVVASWKWAPAGG